MRCGDHPVTGPVEGHYELHLTVKPSGVLDVGRILLDDLHFPQHGVEVTSQSRHHCYDNESNMLIDSTGLNGSVVSITDTNSIDVRNHESNFLREPEISHPGGNVEYQNSNSGTNFTPIGREAVLNRPTWSHRQDAKTSGVSNPQLSSEHRTTLLPHAGNVSGQVKKNDMNSSALQFGHSGDPDGSFLRLGIGNGMEITSNGKFSAQEVSCKLEEQDSSCHRSYHVQETPRSPLNLALSTDRAARLQFYGGGLPNMVNRTSTSEGGGINTGANDFIRSNQLSSSQILQANIQMNLPLSIDQSSGLRLDQKPLPYPNTRILMSHPGYAMPSPLGPELTKPTYFASQPMSGQQQNYCRRSSNNVTPESSLTPHIDWQRGNSIWHSELRNVAEASTTDVATLGFFQTGVQPTGQLFSPHNVSSTEVHGYHLVPGRSRFPVPKGSSFQSVVPDAFPRRLGVQPMDFPAARTGPSPVGLDWQINHVGHTVTTGQHLRGMPSHLPKDFSKVRYTNGQVNPVAKFGAQPRAFCHPDHLSLKRGASEISSATCPNQRRKMVYGPSKYHSVPQQRKYIPAPILTPAQISASPFHIKCQGFDRLPKSCGYNCFLCKRDLSFTSEGPVHQSDAPPAVAVLPCGHTFHDRCLQIITPEDQSKDPTCIPCATGETTK